MFIDDATEMLSPPLLLPRTPRLLSALDDDLLLDVDMITTSCMVSPLPYRYQASIFMIVAVAFETFWVDG